jgi:hypothetical protein
MLLLNWGERLSQEQSNPTKAPLAAGPFSFLTEKNMETETDINAELPEDLAVRLYEESLEIIENTLASIRQNIENKIGATSDLTRVLRMRTDLRKTLDQQSIREIKVTWVESEFDEEKEEGKQVPSSPK